MTTSPVDNIMNFNIMNLYSVKDFKNTHSANSQIMISKTHSLIRGIRFLIEMLGSRDWQRKIQDVPGKFLGTTK